MMHWLGWVMLVLAVAEDHTMTRFLDYRVRPDSSEEPSH